jgi:hypothetical protein
MGKAYSMYEACEKHTSTEFTENTVGKRQLGRSRHR